MAGWRATPPRPSPHPRNMQGRPKMGLASRDKQIVRSPVIPLSEPNRVFIQQIAAHKWPGKTKVRRPTIERHYLYLAPVAHETFEYSMVTHVVTRWEQRVNLRISARNFPPLVRSN